MTDTLTTPQATCGPVDQKRKTHASCGRGCIDRVLDSLRADYLDAVGLPFDVAALRLIPYALCSGMDRRIDRRKLSDVEDALLDAWDTRGLVWYQGGGTFFFTDRSFWTLLATIAFEAHSSDLDGIAERLNVSHSGTSR